MSLSAWDCSPNRSLSQTPAGPWAPSYYYSALSSPTVSSTLTTLPRAALRLICSPLADTGKMLAKMMMRDSSLLTYADVLIKAYGHSARTFIYGMCTSGSRSPTLVDVSLTFAAPSLVVLELGALSIALVVLFSDSMNSLFPAVSSSIFKLMFFFM